ncbi:MAG: NCS2 family permease, partial [Gammaproteobacteria bacterium]|nr:NCS2 family permease [Gammaproteobacteria bacterium]
EEADIIAWHTGILACVLSGMIEFFGAFVVDYIRRATPRIVLLVAKAGTALAFLSLDYVFRTFAHPILGFTSLALVLIFYFGGVRLRGGIPAGFVILAIGTGLAWLMAWGGYSSVVPGNNFDLSYFGLHFPVPEITRIFSSFDFIAEFLPVVIPFGFIFLIGSLQNIESAAAAGDEYRPRPLLLMNGVGSLTAAAFGSPFPTTIFLGHPGYKQIGARAGYSTLNAICWTAVCLTGVLSAVTYVIPIEAVMPIIIWLGVVICAQNFQVADVKHMPAIVIGLLPAIAAYVGLAIEHTLVVAGRITDTNLFDPSLVDSFESMRGFYADGVFTLSQGYIYLCMIWAGITYYVIEHRFNTAAIWCGVGALLSLVGFTHLYRFSGSDVIGVFALPVPVWSKWTAAYLIMGAIFLVTARLIRDEGSGPAPPATGPRI